MLNTPILIILEPDTEAQEQLVKAFECTRFAAEFVFVTSEDALLQVLSDLERTTLKSAARRGVVLLSVELAAQTTYKLLKKIKGNPDHAHIPLVVMSHKFNTSQLEEAYRMGVNSVVHKPLRSSSITEIVAVFDQYWFGHVSLPSFSQPDQRESEHQ